MKKLRCILLVEDNAADVFLHKRAIRKAGCADDVAVARHGAEALSYLSTPVAGKYPQPNLIFLDINMPIMNGWEFLDAYHLLPPEQQGDQVVVMLTTSLNPDDRRRAEEHGCVHKFLSKPLTIEALQRLVEEYFPES